MQNMRKTTFSAEKIWYLPYLLQSCLLYTSVTLKKHSGRNSRGKITVRHRGGGYRPKYRIIDFKRNKDGIPGTVATIEYDPNRTANIALINLSLIHI